MQVMKEKKTLREIRKLKRGAKVVDVDDNEETGEEDMQIVATSNSNSTGKRIEQSFNVKKRNEIFNKYLF